MNKEKKKRLLFISFVLLAVTITMFFWVLSWHVAMPGPAEMKEVYDIDNNLSKWRGDGEFRDGGIRNIEFDNIGEIKEENQK